MATGKPKSGAGPYAGYKKNYAPIKSSKGTKAEKVVGKVIAAAGGGVKPQKVKVAGKTMTTKPTEAGLGVVGAMAKAAARTAARNAGQSAKGFTQKEVKAVREARRVEARKTAQKRAEKFPRYAEVFAGPQTVAAMEKSAVGRGVGGFVTKRSKTKAQSIAKGMKGVDKSFRDIAKNTRRPTMAGQSKPSISFTKPKVSVKAKTSPKKRGK